jgi:hypothetical protein
MKMKVKRITTVIALLAISLSTLTYSQVNNKPPLLCSGGIITGYNRGYGTQTNFTVRGFSTEFPFEVRFGIGYTILNPGNASDARRIFINNATNGIPEKKGGSFDCRFDFLLPKSIFRVNHSYIVFGPRFSTFKGNFKYIGGNEDFDITSHQWGIGGAIEHHFRMISNLSLIIHYGLDHYFPSTLTGHDTSYSPDNDNVNPTNDNQNEDHPFTYKDADKAIKQPMFMPRAMIGVSFTL